MRTQKYRIQTHKNSILFFNNQNIKDVNIFGQFSKQGKCPIKRAALFSCLLTNSIKKRDLDRRQFKEQGKCAIKCAALFACLLTNSIEKPDLNKIYIRSSSKI